MNYQKIISCYIRDLNKLQQYMLNKTIFSITIGGGSPSIIKKKVLKELIEYIFKNYKLSKKVEISIETNPEDINKKKLEQYKKIGINRICIGVQSFSNNELKYLGRKYRKKKAIDSILTSSDYFDNIGIDLLFGIPGSKKETFEKQLYFTRGLPVKHISLYEFNFQNRKKPIFLEDTSFFENNKKILEEKKFFLYETNSFSISGYQSYYNNSVLSMKDYLGIGPSSQGRIMMDNKFVRIGNTKILENWLDPNKNTYKKETFNKQKEIEELLMLGLSKYNGISIQELEEATENKISKYINKSNINELERNEFLIQKRGRLFLSIKGMLVINTIVSKILI